MLLMRCDCIASLLVGAAVSCHLLTDISCGCRSSSDMPEIPGLLSRTAKLQLESPRAPGESVVGVAWPIERLKWVSGIRASFRNVVEPIGRFIAMLAP